MTHAVWLVPLTWRSLQGCQLAADDVDSGTNCVCCSLGMVLLVVYGSQLLWNAMFVRQRNLLIVAAMLVLGGFCMRTVVRNKDWTTRETLAM